MNENPRSWRAARTVRVAVAVGALVGMWLVVCGAKVQGEPPNDGRRVVPASASKAAKNRGTPPLPIRRIADVFASPATADAIAPHVDDATLRDVQFVGSKTAWAVGDHGAVWTSADGGGTWRRVVVPTTCPLRSVSFLTDRVGWIAGSEYDPYTRIGTGVLLVTKDGGATWQRLAEALLPPLAFVKFFDLNRGVAVGEASLEHPTGVLATDDGGETWRSLPGETASGWRAASFLSPDYGAIAGLRGRVALVGDGRLTPPRMGELGLRGVHGVTMQPDETGWLVGDGGLAMRTDDGGVVWKDPPKPLPIELRDMTDFHAVAVRGENTWLAGSPGSVVWHTPDGGNSWARQRTGNAAPLRAIRFANDRVGLAVGEFGAILRTQDGGETWEAVRGGGRRAAMLCAHAWPARTSFELVAALSGEFGYRSVVLLPPRGDVGPDGHEQLDADWKLHAATTRVGGSAAEIGWRFPLAVPGLEKVSDKLLADWTQRSEGRLAQVFLGSLVATIRMWRPSLIVLDQPPADDAAANLVNDAVRKAVEQAADSTRFIDQIELAGLDAWQVERIYVRLPAGSAGPAGVDPHALLPRLRSTPRNAAEGSRRLIAPTIRPATGRDAYRLDFDREQQGNAALATKEFFTGVPILPGSAARRALGEIDDADLDRQQELAIRQRNFQAVSEQVAGDPRQGAQLLAQLREATHGMSDAQAAAQLVRLIDEYRRQGRQDLVEATSVELVTRFPDEPASRDAMRWLFQLWTGAEPAWQRARHTAATMQRLDSPIDRISERIARVAELAATPPEQRDLTQLDLSPDPLQFSRIDGELQTGPNQAWRSGAVRNWHDQALRMASLIRTKDPLLYKQAEIQFPLAALMKHRGVDRYADAVYRRQGRSSPDDPWRLAAEAETWLLQPLALPPKKFAICRSTPQRPVLDGVLSDLCWQNAEEIRLEREVGGRRAEVGEDEGPRGQRSGGGGRGRGERSAGRLNRSGNADGPSSSSLSSDLPRLTHPSSAFAMIAYDAEYFYFAASVPWSPETPSDRPRKEGRAYDADLSRFDRLALCLDVDRDYATYYAFHVDQRGLTSESCFDDASWNPKWHVAAAADDRHWRVEIAIPWSELGPAAPQHNEVWAMGIVRTIPTVGYESWTHPAGAKPRPEAFGLVRFE